MINFAGARYVSSLGDNLAVNCTRREGAHDILSLRLLTLSREGGWVGGCSSLWYLPLHSCVKNSQSPSQQSKRDIFLERTETKEIGARRQME